MTSPKVASLLTLAAEDLQVASEPTTPGRPAAYHLSQAVEKAARAVCEFEGIHVGTTHNIGQIGALLRANHPMRDAIEAQNYHSPASTRYRYPDPSGNVPHAPSRGEILRRATEVANFLDTVRRYVSDDHQSS